MAARGSIVSDRTAKIAGKDLEPPKLAISEKYKSESMREKTSGELSKSTREANEDSRSVYQSSICRESVLLKIEEASLCRLLNSR